MPGSAVKAWWCCDLLDRFYVWLPRSSCIPHRLWATSLQNMSHFQLFLHDRHLINTSINVTWHICGSYVTEGSFQDKTEILNFHEQVSSTHVRKLTQLYFCIFCKKNILSFNISMDDMVSMKMCQALKENQTFFIPSSYHYHDCVIIVLFCFYPSQTLLMGKVL